MKLEGSNFLKGRNKTQQQQSHSQEIRNSNQDYNSRDDRWKIRVMCKPLVQDVLLSHLISSDQLVCVFTQKFPASLLFGAMLFTINTVRIYNDIDSKRSIVFTEEFFKHYVI